MRKITILFFLFLLVLPLFSQEWSWARGFGSEMTESISAMEVLNDGAVLLAGSYGGEIVFDGQNLEAISGSDAFLVKLDALGNTLWAKSGGSLSNDQSVAVDVDATGNIYWLGQYWIEGFFENDTISSGSNSKAYFIAKYDSDGTYQWVKTINGTFTKVFTDLVVDDQGTIYLSGYFSDTLKVGGTDFIAQANEDAVILKMTNNGALEWGKQYGIEGDIRPQKIEQTSDGKLILGGDFMGSVSFELDTLTSVTTDFDIFITLLEEDGTTVWSNMGTGVFDNLLRAIEVDAMDNIYLSGSFEGVLELNGSEILTPGFNDNFYLIKLDVSGTVDWMRGLDALTFNDPSFGADISIKDDLVILAGLFSDDLIIDDLQINSGSNINGFLANFSTENGVAKKLYKIDGTSSTSASQVDVGPNGLVHVAGDFFETIYFDDEINAIGFTDFFIAKANDLFTPIDELFFENAPVLIHPNPAKEKLYLSTLDTSFSLEIFDLYGRMVLSKKNKKEIAINSLIAGNYFIRYTSLETVQIIPFLKL